MTKPLISLSGIQKSFDKHIVLDNVSLEVNEGDFISFLGLSGCGKTTLLKIMNGLDTNFDGSVLFNGNTLSGDDMKNFSLVSQDATLMPWLSVEENVHFFSDLLGQEKNPSLVSKIGLASFENHLPHELSGGMKKRVVLARALATNPSVLFLDEPFANLDTFNKLKMISMVNDLCDNNGSTAVLITHDIDEALRLSNKIVILGANPTTIVDVLDFGKKLEPFSDEYNEVKKQLHEVFSV